ncbi:class I SAM-dependent methyltransferase [Amycolatopsis echigonensis]|uniref:Methyltransferase domain-containing protein n=1 Tax=Amycolatopsis echigonensis TaxID=2576905 RepID=A0A2N3WU47_9PSEU|nr:MULTISPECIES: methyltransferase domain-containing protein [Amycolatopsis]MBB2503502.1 methyltransferase domain-containing protein [Amycolatopsis echigonensis]PKV97382.1 methyltransferase family protein [Amycolatopsis niigatensis]
MPDDAIDPDEEARRRAGLALANGDPTGWFEPLYAAAEAGEAVLPWYRGEPSPELAAWVAERPGNGRRALVVGCGMADDAELLAAAGYETSAFDVSPSAIKAVLNRFPDTVVSYRTADLLTPPAEFHYAFDLVVEIMTVQSMPKDAHDPAIASVSGFVAPGGTLVVGAVAEENIDLATWSGPPWPLSKAEVESFARDGVTLTSLERVRDDSRWWAEFTR